MSKLISSNLLVLCAVLFGAGSSHAQNNIVTHLPLAEVQDSLATQGPVKTLEKYFPCDSQSNLGYEDVSSGDPQWLKLAANMVEDADNCHAEELVDAIGLAMTAAPQNALPLVGTSERLSAENICLPFIPDVLPIKEQLRQVKMAQTAIQQVKEVWLQKQKNECLGFIQDVEKSIHSSAATTIAPLPPIH